MSASARRLPAAILFDNDGVLVDTEALYFRANREILATIGVAVAATLLFSTLTYSLRDLSRVRLAEYLERHNATRWLEPTVDHADDLIFVTAVSRMLANTLLVLASLWLCNRLLTGTVTGCLCRSYAESITARYFYQLRSKLQAFINKE